MKNLLKLFKIGFLSAILLVLMNKGAYAQNIGDYRSNGTGNWATLATWQRWSGAAWNTPSAALGYPGQNITGISGTVTIRDTHTVTLNVSPALSIGNLVVGAGTSGILVAGVNANSSFTLTCAGDVTISAGGTLRTGGDGGGTHTLSVSGNFINNGIFNFNFAGADLATVTFDGAATRTISGTGGTSIFSGLTLNKTLGADVNISLSLQVNGAINFSANGLLIVGSSGNITLGTAATISGVASNRYIQLDGTNGSESKLIRINGGNVNDWKILFPIGTSSGGYTPVDLSGSTITNNPTAGSTLAVKAIYGADVAGHLRRTFRLSVVGNAVGTTLSTGSFSYAAGSDIATSDVIANYSTLWFLDTSTGSWSSVAGTVSGTSPFIGPTAGQMLSTGTYFYTIGSPTTYQTWYTYQSGLWNNPDNWTQDPTGTTLVNPFTTYPTAGDVVVILNGFTITNNLNNQNLFATTIEGGAILDMTATTGNGLGSVMGDGLLRMNGSNLPTGTYTSFVASNGGTIEYYNTSGTLPSSQTTYNNLLLTNNSNSAVTFTTASNLIINNNLNVTQTAGTGSVTWRINDGTDAQRILSINGNLNVSANGRIRAGTGNSASTSPHTLSIAGSIINNGSIKFFDDTDATLSDANYASQSIYSAALRGNAVTVTFTGLTDAAVTCNGLTDFYRLIVNKGSGQQSMLTINSSSIGNFRLFGPNDEDYSGGAPQFISDNNLSIANGTLQLTGSINIPSLAVNAGAGIGGGWPIPQTGALWVNSPNVTIQVTNTTDTGDNGRQIYVFGLLRMSSGTLNSGFSRGILGGGSGVLIVEGGTINTPQIRTTYLGSNNRFAYIQTGGTVNVGTGLSGTGVPTTVNTYPRFALPYAECSFSMSGGTLNVFNPTASGTSTYGGILIFAATSNIQVTGGTVSVNIPITAISFTITSTAPFYNLNISKDGPGGTAQAILGAMNFNDGTGYLRAAQPLTVLNDMILKTGNGPSLSCGVNNLTIGGNIDVQSGATLTASANVVTLNGSGAQTWTNDGTISTLNNVVMSKAAISTLTLAGANTFPSVVNLSLISGSLNDGGKTLIVTSSISNSAVHTGTGAITVTGPTAIGGTGGTFGNLNVTTNSTVTVSGNQTVTSNLRLTAANTTLDIGSNNLAVLGNIYDAVSPAVTVGFTTSKRILTKGLRNDGGLTRQATSGTYLLFPVGTSLAATAYTPASINVTASTAGRITVRPVTGAHTNVTTTSQSVQYFWRVTSTGFAGITSVVHKDYQYLNATRDAASANYRPARYDASAVPPSWSYGPVYNATSGTGQTIIAPNVTNTFDTSTGWTGVTGTQLDGEYTAGNLAAFGAVTTYYSKTSGNWSLNTTWSTDNVLKHAGANAASAPCATCPVVIGDGVTYNHTVINNANNQACGSLFIASGSTLDCGASTGLNFGVNTSGTGTLRISGTSSFTFPAGDFTNFLTVGGGTIDYYGGNTSPTPIPVSSATINLLNYNNLKVSPSTGNFITLPAVSALTVYNDLIISGTGTGQVNTEVAAARSITVNGIFNVKSGRLNMVYNGATNITSLILNGSTVVDNGAFMTVATTGGAGTHTIQTTGSITNDGTLDLNDGSGRAVDITLTGTNDVTIGGSNAGGADFNLLRINKGNSQAVTVNFSMGGNVIVPTSNWLVLQNGTFNFNKSSGTNPIVLTSTAATPYSIPASTKLKVQNGTLNISSIAANDSDLLLSGTIEVAGGILNVGPGATANNNDIEYASAGTPTITVSSGSLYVNGSIRRPTTTLSGSLIYNQMGGTTTVGGRASDNTRGVFEIENNSGSSFSLLGTSVLAINRPSAVTSYADLYLNPVTSNVASTSTIQIGANALGTQSLTVDISPSIGNFNVMGAASNGQTVTMRSNALTTSGTLTINASSTLATNSLNVNIGGDLTIVGTYDGSNNTTTFNGGGAQAGALTAGSTFQNITINKPSGTATLSGTTSITNLNILSGILSISGTLNVNGNVVNNSVQVGAGFVTFGGTSTTHSISSSGGSFTNLTLGAGSATKNISVTGDLTINGVLNFAATNRFLNIGASLLTFGPTATISNASSTAFVRLNGVTSDLGVTRNWPTGTSSFTYPIGTGNTYAPIAFTLNVTALGAGDLNIVPVSQKHPTYNLASAERILNYYWIITRSSSLAYSNTGSHVYTYPSTLISGTGGTLVAGLLDVANPTGWVTSAHGGTANTTTMTFTNLLNVNLPTSGNTFHYTVGTVNTLPNPIVPVYSRLSDASVSNTAVGGSWNIKESWTTSPTGFGTALTSPPTGVPVVILPGARINMTSNARTAFKSQNNGLLVIGTTFGHNMGNISGTGTMRVATTTFPSGNYTAFVAAGGGTIEYVAPMTMNNRTTYNNLSIYSGTPGVVTMTNSDLIINGSVTVPSGTTLDNSVNNRSMLVAGNWNNTGTFAAGTSTVTFNGSGAQSTTGSTTFNNVVINKSNNLTLGGVTTINNALTLTAGNVVSNAYPSAPRLVLGATTTINGGSASSFVSGQIQKNMNSGASFTYPLGSVSAARYRPVTIFSTSSSDTWNVSYVGNDPTNEGYSSTTINVANMAKVSQFEYWQVANVSTTTTAGLTLSYGPGSYGTSDIGDVNQLKTARWDGTQWDLPPGGGSFSQSGDNVSGTVTVSFQDSFSPQTIATDDRFSSLPINLISFTANRFGAGVVLNWSTAQEVNNDRFEVERSSDGYQFKKIATVQGAGNSSVTKHYVTTDKEFVSGVLYYRLKQVDFDEKFSYSNVVKVDPADGLQQAWIAYPNPVGAEGSIQLGKANTDVDENVTVDIIFQSTEGRILLRGNGTVKEINKRLSGSMTDLAAGIYILQVFDGNSHDVVRIVKH